MKTSNQSRGLRAFTLTELLIVVALMVVLLALAVPAFNYITGARSVEGASNIISAMLGRARAAALNDGKYIGVLFYVDPVSGRTVLATVEYDDAKSAADIDPLHRYKAYVSGATYYGPPDTPPTSPPTVPPSPDRVIQVTQDGEASFTNRPLVKHYQRDDPPAPGGGTPHFGAPHPPENGPAFSNARWIEVVEGNLSFAVSGEYQFLPRGVAAQVVVDTEGSNSVDRYVRTGLILFDPQGRIDKRLYSIRHDMPLGEKMGLNTDLGDGLRLYSGLGVAVYDREAFIGEQRTEGDVKPLIPHLDSPGGYSPEERDEENWLDNNATLYMVNRTNGTLLEGR